MFSDYKYYKNEHNGNLSELEYDKLAFDAYNEIIAQTRGRAEAAHKDMQERLKICECKLIDAIQANEQASMAAGIASENNDGLSVSYFPRRDTERAEKSQYYGICRRYLTHPHNLMGVWL